MKVKYISDFASNFLNISIDIFNTVFDKFNSLNCSDQIKPVDDEGRCSVYKV